MPTLHYRTYRLRMCNSPSRTASITLIRSGATIRSTLRTTLMTYFNQYIRVLHRTEILMTLLLKLNSESQSFCACISSITIVATRSMRDGSRLTLIYLSSTSLQEMSPQRLASTEMKTDSVTDLDECTKESYLLESERGLSVVDVGYGAH
ncbi:hypothetical protein Tco_0520589 [Tanacetum coccineum]